MREKLKQWLHSHSFKYSFNKHLGNNFTLGSHGFGFRDHSGSLSCSLLLFGYDSLATRKLFFLNCHSSFSVSCF